MKNLVDINCMEPSELFAGNKIQGLPNWAYDKAGAL